MKKYDDSLFSHLILIKQKKIFGQHTTQSNSKISRFVKTNSLVQFVVILPYLKRSVLYELGIRFDQTCLHVPLILATFAR